jgi:hypothetical protein
LDSTMGPEAIGGSFSTNHGCSTSSGKPRVRFGQLVSSLWKQFWNCLEIQNSWREGVISISRFLTGSPNLATKKKTSRVWSPVIPTNPSLENNPLKTRAARVYPWCVCGCKWSCQPLLCMWSAMFGFMNVYSRWTLPTNKHVYKGKF